MPETLAAWVAEALTTSGAYAAGTYTVTATAGAATWTAINAAVLVATTAAVTYGSQTLARSMAGNKAAFPDSGRNVMIRDPIAPRRKIYGQVLVTGPMYPIGVSGTKNEFFHFAVILAGHECAELGDIYF